MTKARQETVIATEDTLKPEAWEAVYQSGTTPWDLQGPTPELVRLAAAGEFAPESRILFPGSGKGHDPVEFAKRGFRVTALDFAPSAVAETKASAAKSGVTVETVAADLFEWCQLTENAGRFDYVVEQTIFCAIHPDRRRDFARAMAAVLKPGGKLVTLIFPLEERQQHLAGPPFGVSLKSVEDSYAPYFELKILPTQATIKPRLGREALGIFTKKS